MKWDTSTSIDMPATFSKLYWYDLSQPSYARHRIVLSTTDEQYYVAPPIVDRLEQVLGDGSVTLVGPFQTLEAAQIGVELL
jgi:hypothetical protein